MAKRPPIVTDPLFMKTMARMLATRHQTKGGGRATGKVKPAKKPAK